MDKRERCREGQYWRDSQKLENGQKIESVADADMSIFPSTKAGTDVYSTSDCPPPPLAHILWLHARTIIIIIVSRGESRSEGWVVKSKINYLTMSCCSR